MTSSSNVASFLAYQIDTSQKSAKEISDEAGFARPNIISMLKAGVTKVPIARVIDLARALDVDKVRFFRMCMEEYMPDILRVCDEVYSADRVTDSEREVLAYLRTISGGEVPGIGTRADDLLQDWVKAAKGNKGA